ncbi:hypothetical protein [Burkholderia pseudomallei]|uniref:hypothetical protein n=1 Tax=Burkholderia pseudomallei TaxID=28450 RepID=UPI00288083B4|nr:hypothetical protein [Burkholderia pseudomallei]
MTTGSIAPTCRGVQRCDAPARRVGYSRARPTSRGGRNAPRRNASRISHASIALHIAPRTARTPAMRAADGARVRRSLYARGAIERAARHARGLPAQRRFVRTRRDPRLESAIGPRRPPRRADRSTRPATGMPSYGMNNSPGRAARRYPSIHRYACAHNYQDHVSIAA